MSLVSSLFHALTRQMHRSYSLQESLNISILNSPILIMVADLKFTISKAEIWVSFGRSDPLGFYFSQLLLRHGLMDVPLDKILPTWKNGRVGDSGFCKRLDQVIVTDSWVYSVDHF